MRKRSLIFSSSMVIQFTTNSIRLTWVEMSFSGFQFTSSYAFLVLCVCMESYGVASTVESETEGFLDLNIKPIKDLVQWHFFWCFLFSWCRMGGRRNHRPSGMSQEGTRCLFIRMQASRQVIKYENLSRSIQKMLIILLFACSFVSRVVVGWWLAWYGNRI